MEQQKKSEALNNNVISKIVASMWRQESVEVKATYSAKAEAEKKAHLIKYPGYKYRPKKNKKSSKSESGSINYAIRPNATPFDSGFARPSIVSITPVPALNASPSFPFLIGAAPPFSFQPTLPIPRIIASSPSGPINAFTHIPHQLVTAPSPPQILFHPHWRAEPPNVQLRKYNDIDGYRPNLMIARKQ